MVETCNFYSFCPDFTCYLHSCIQSLCYPCGLIRIIDLCWHLCRAHAREIGPTMGRWDDELVLYSIVLNGLFGVLSEETHILVFILVVDIDAVERLCQFMHFRERSTARFNQFQIGVEAILPDVKTKGILAIIVTHDAAVAYFPIAQHNGEDVAVV